MRTEQELERLILQHRYMIKPAARVYGGRLADDPDLLQCGMIGLWRAAQEWDGKRPFRPLAKVCIRHAMVDHLRRMRRWEETVDLSGEAERMAGAAWDTPDEQALDKAICEAYPAGSGERAVLRGLLSGRSKESIARRCGTTRKQVTVMAKEAWEKVDV